MGWKYKLAVLSIMAWAGSTAPALAASSEDQPLKLPEPSGSRTPTVDSGGMFLKTLLALAFTLLVIWLVYRLMKKINLRTSRSGSGPAVEVLSRTQLDKEMSIYVLRLGDDVSVVSRSGSGSSLIRQMSSREAEESGLLSSVNPSDQRVRTVIGDLKNRFRFRPVGRLEKGQVDELLADSTWPVDRLLSEDSCLTVDQLLEQSE